jgi:small subunit ribosomal protein S18
VSETQNPQNPGNADEGRPNRDDRPSRPSYGDRDRGDRGGRGGPGGPGGDRRRRPRGRFPRRKVCPFCADKIPYIDYKDVVRLRHFVSDRGKILPRRVTGTCAKHQRSLTTAIKRARIIALLPHKSV